jgi:hypothetical protein
VVGVGLVLLQLRKCGVELGLELGQFLLACGECLAPPIEFGGPVFEPSGCGPDGFPFLLDLALRAVEIGLSFLEGRLRLAKGGLVLANLDLLFLELFPDGGEFFLGASGLGEGSLGLALAGVDGLGAVVEGEVLLGELLLGLRQVGLPLFDGGLERATVAVERGSGAVDLGDRAIQLGPPLLDLGHSFLNRFLLGRKLSALRLEGVAFLAEGAILILQFGGACFQRLVALIELRGPLVEIRDSGFDLAPAFFERLSLLIEFGMLVLQGLVGLGQLVLGRRMPLLEGLGFLIQVALGGLGLGVKVFFPLLEIAALPEQRLFPLLDFLRGLALGPGGRLQFGRPPPKLFVLDLELLFMLVLLAAELGERRLERLLLFADLECLAVQLLAVLVEALPMLFELVAGVRGVLLGLDKLFLAGGERLVAASGFGFELSGRGLEFLAA